MTASWSVVCRRIEGCRPSPKTWDEATNSAPWHKSIDIRFLAGMTGEPCGASVMDSWGRMQHCARNVNHTGRHLATNYNIDYPVAVWS